MRPIIIALMTTIRWQTAATPPPLPPLPPLPSPLPGPPSPARADYCYFPRLQLPLLNVSITPTIAIVAKLPENGHPSITCAVNTVNSSAPINTRLPSRFDLIYNRQFNAD